MEWIAVGTAAALALIGIAAIAAAIWYAFRD
jgi:hypothetical protein